MDEAETKTCTNCKREIPAVNFTTHAVHCARNIKVCPVCKEPVLQQDLQDHHDKMHKLLPCPKCGERVCGTDMEDHIRDSCAHTIKSCRFCELELPRRELPVHEGYCGVRTEQCPACREWVMLKYRQLHLDTNHGFIRLDDDPMPVQRPAHTPLTALAPLSPLSPASSEAVGQLAGFSPAQNTNGYVKNTNVDRSEGRPVIKPGPSGSGYGSSGSGGSALAREGARPLKRTNDQPQLNTNVVATDKVQKNLGMSRGAVKKRPAPLPPAAPGRDLPYYSAVQRRQDEARRRDEQNAINAAQGLPPVLNPLEKLERLRKMDALHNRETQSPPRSPAARLPRPSDQQLQASPDRNYLQDRRNELRNIKPMTPEEFMDRFNALQVERDSGGWSDGGRDRGDRRDNRDVNGRSAGSSGSSSAGNDRFSEIKSSLRELRRGLNEVTAPYNSSPVNSEPIPPRQPERQSGRTRPVTSSSSSAASSDDDRDRDDDVRLPCEFCDRLLPLDHLVIHQTGCRPDLAQVNVRDTPPQDRSPRGPRDPRDNHNLQDPQDPQDPRDNHNRRDPQNPRDPRYNHNPRDPQDPRDPRYNHNPRDPQDPRDLRDNQKPRDPRNFRDARVPSPMQLPPLRFMDQVVQRGGGRQAAGQVAAQADLSDLPVIPCEFCTESLPIYLIQDHQEMCRREEFLLYPD